MDEGETGKGKGKKKRKNNPQSQNQPTEKQNIPKTRTPQKKPVEAVFLKGPKRKADGIKD